jgi:hypothetical protein
VQILLTVVFLILCLVVLARRGSIRAAEEEEAAADLATSRASAQQIAGFVVAYLVSRGALSVCDGVWPTGLVTSWLLQRLPVIAVH